EQAQAKEALERARTQQMLYDALVREARATRTARPPGYRDNVFKLLNQARALDVPKKDLCELRCEASQCLGDFLGLTPVEFTDFPANIVLTRLDPRTQLAAFVLKDSTILLRQLPSGQIVARLRGRPGLQSLCFSSDSNELISVVHPAGSS